MTTQNENQRYDRETFKQVCNKLLSSNNVLILTHKSPDGDTLGSGFALSEALISLGKNVEVLNNDEIPENYSFIINEKKLEDKPDLIVSVDIATTSLLGDNLEKYKDIIDISIDHHLSNEHYAKLTLVDSGSSACCEIIFDIVREMGVTITPSLADALYTGIATDTGCFRYSSTTNRTLRIAADLIDFGAHTAKLNKMLFETISRERLVLEKLALNTIELELNDKVAIMLISKEMYEISKAKESETEGIASLPSRIKGVKVGITFKEKDDGYYKISMRSSGEINVSDVCKKLGGGGHSCAAGATIKGDYITAKNKILDILQSINI